MNIWAFANVDNDHCREAVVKSIKKDGVSRFGWGSKDSHNLTIEENFWRRENGKQRFLLRIKPGDWIVHVNAPQWGRCIAAKVTSGYYFEKHTGLNDFGHSFKIDKDSVVDFDRHDPNVLPTVNLAPRRRGQRISAVEDFLTSIKNLEAEKNSETKEVQLDESTTKEVHHLQNKTEGYLEELVQLIQENHRGKKLEEFMANVFRQLPTVEDVKENGSPGWGSDHGADLILTASSLDILGSKLLEQTVVVQIKSFTGDHNNTNAVEDIKRAVEHYGNISAGIIITTAKSTDLLKQAISKAQDELGLDIQLIAGKEVAQFVLQHAPDMLFRLSS